MITRNALLTAVTASLAVTVTHAGSDRFNPPATPANIKAPAGAKLAYIARAAGTQNYMCLPSGAGLAWTPVGPQATLYDAQLNQVMTHFLSLNPFESEIARPTWHDSGDSSTIWAQPIASSSDAAFVTPGAIPWLLLRIVGAQDGTTGGRLTAVTFMQRVNTVGGAAPATACLEAGTRAFVPYEADYVFYKSLGQE